MSGYCKQREKDMATEQYISVGKIGKPHGLSGAFRFFLDRELKSNKKVPGHFVMNLKGNFTPWFVKSVEWIGFNEGYVLFEEITSSEHGKQYSGTELCLGEKDLNVYFKKNAQSLDYLIGYVVTDEADGEVGIIEEVIENPGQVLLSVAKDGKDVMIPFVEEFVVSVNKRKKELVLSLPEGLLSSQM
jgi:16S rRNA processing protein RimM